MTNDHISSSRTVVLSAILTLFTGCNGELPPAPTPTFDATPPPPVVGHWIQDGRPYGETEALQVEADGSYSATTDGQSLSTFLSLSYLTSGTWSVSNSWLKLTDIRAGSHAFGATFQADTMTLTGSATWVFHRDAPDAGPD